MNYTQNTKIEQVTEKTLVVGVDIGSESHFARIFDWRGIEISRKAYQFTSDLEGFNLFYGWVQAHMIKAGKTKIFVGAEPTGHYWFSFAKYIKERGMKLVFVNPYHVKQSKELDDNSPNKNDRKDPKTIAKLVIDGRYSIPYVPEGIYADIRETVSSRDRIMKERNALSNRIQRWLKIYFPEYLKVYGNFDSMSGLLLLKAAQLPEDIIKLGPEGINKIWRLEKVRAVGMKRAMTLCEAAHNSVGIPGGVGSRKELLMLLEDYETKNRQLDEVTQIITEVIEKVPHVGKLLAIKGVGIITVAGFLAEVGDIGRFDSPKQIQKLAGLELRENSSGKHKGRTTISKRGRKKLRKILFQVALPLVGSNEEFREIYDYYRKREKNPLKGRQALIAVSCKLIRVMYAILSKGTVYDPGKLQGDIKRQNAA